MMIRESRNLTLKIGSAKIFMLVLRSFPRNLHIPPHCFLRWDMKPTCTLQIDLSGHPQHLLKNVM